MTDAPYSNDLIISWDRFHDDAMALGDKLAAAAPSGGWKGIVAIARGGLIPAGIVAQSLSIKMIDTFCIATYAHQDMGASSILKIPQLDRDGEGWLVIDDLADTGGTFRAIRKSFPKAHFAAPYAKPKGLDAVDTYLTEIPQETWIYLPWEAETVAKLREQA